MQASGITASGLRPDCGIVESMTWAHSTICGLVYRLADFREGIGDLMQLSGPASRRENQDR
jgi:hypothetical protein